MNFKLPDTMVRYKDARNVHAELQEIQQQHSTDQIPDHVSDEASRLLDINQQFVDEEGLPKLLEALDQTIQSAPVFDIILPAYPHDSFLSEVGGWFRREIHATSLLKIRVRRSISGGMVLRSKNQLFDMSLRHKILDTKSKIPEVMRRV